MGAFCFIDELGPFCRNESLEAFFTLKGSEEFLKDHFEGFPVMPGVLMLEALTQTSMRCLADSQQKPVSDYRLAEVGEVRFGQFVKPGYRVKIAVKLAREENGLFWFDGRLDFMQDGKAAGKVLTASLGVARAA